MGSQGGGQGQGQVQEEDLVWDMKPGECCWRGPGEEPAGAPMSPQCPAPHTSEGLASCTRPNR